jgi:hypothetical protein
MTRDGRRRLLPREYSHASRFAASMRKSPEFARGVFADSVEGEVKTLLEIYTTRNPNDISDNVVGEWAEPEFRITPCSCERAKN